MTMKLALFASDQVGLEVMKILNERGVLLACLVLDENDRAHKNESIAAAGGYSTLMWSRELQTEQGLRAFGDLQIDLGLLAWWPNIIRDDVIALARRGFLNFHPSLLPHARGKDPNFWAIVEERPFGVTLHHVSSKIDAGDIAFQKEIEVTWEDTGETVYEKARKEIVTLFRDNLDLIMAGKIPRVTQDLELGTFHKRDELDAASMIDLDEPTTARRLLNLIRARTFEGHPAARFVDNDELYEVRTRIEKITKDNP